MTPLVTRRQCLGMLAATTVPLGALAQPAAYPSKVIKLIVPYPAGGGNDVLARSVAEKWQKAWGQGAIVDNRPGANGSVATEFVSHAAPDGYTLLMGSVATHAINPVLPGNQIRYDADKDFIPIALIGTTPLVLTVHPSIKATNVKEFIALAKQAPDTITYASVGLGSAGHLSGELFQLLSGTKLVHVPYKGISLASTELMGGFVKSAFSNVLNVLPMIKTGKLRALGVTGSKPLEALPGVPPIGNDLPGYTVELWWGLFAPAKTPAEVIKKLHDESNKYLSAPEAQARWAQEGITLTPMTQPDFAALRKRDAARWAEVITSRKIVAGT